MVSATRMSASDDPSSANSCKSSSAPWRLQDAHLHRVKHMCCTVASQPSSSIGSRLCIFLWSHTAPPAIESSLPRHGNIHPGSGLIQHPPGSLSSFFVYSSSKNFTVIRLIFQPWSLRIPIPPHRLIPTFQFHTHLIHPFVKVTFPPDVDTVRPRTPSDLIPWAQKIEFESCK